ncbi:MAG TPA: M23 family metallopeptidase, partial [Polyangiaceae bacterium]
RHDVTDASELADLTVDAGIAEAAVPPPRAFRVSDLAGDSRLELLEGTIGKRPLLAALQTAGVGPKEAQRVLHAFDGVKNMDRLAVKDTFVVARDKATGHVVAFELSVTPSDVWQAREDEDGKLTGKKLDLFVEHRRVDAAFAVLGDLRSSLTSAKLDEDLLEKIDDAIDGHAELSDLKPGVRLRVIATEERVEGAFVGYSSLDAVEYLPVGRPSLRVYFWDKGAVDPKKDHARSGSGFYDDKGRQPFHGGWRSPVPGARISSRFNPNRMHPVLHVVMPHNGIDFAAPSGTPVYAAASGVVRSAGDSGPCGNMVMIDHPNGLTTAYCHMSKFAPGIRAGLRVETRQLVGYVGQTGRATGPHLHFAVKRGDVFLDPMILKLDGVRVVPPKERGAFDERRTALDAELDAIPLPDAESSGDGGAGDDDGGAEVYFDDPH